jgi:hypothetical protein
MEGALVRVEAIGKPEGCKLLRISADVTDPLDPNCALTSLSIRGDFFAIPEEKFEEIEKALEGTSLSSLPEAYNRLVAAGHIYTLGITGEGIRETIAKALHEASS